MGLCFSGEPHPHQKRYYSRHNQQRRVPNTNRHLQSNMRNNFVNSVVHRNNMLASYDVGNACNDYGSI